MVKGEGPSGRAAVKRVFHEFFDSPEKLQIV
jgi:hypothetical protein